MEMFVIYHNPSDFPGKFVVRRFVIHHSRTLPDAEPLAVVDTLRAARAAIPRTANVRWQRAATDDPVILETWM